MNFRCVSVIAAAFTLTILLSGCGKTNETVSSAPVRQSAVVTAELKTQLTDTVNNYLAALSDHDYYSLTGCATENVLLCRDQTAFEDFTVGIAEASLETADLDNVILSDNSGYIFRIKYTLDFSGSYIDTDGTEREPGIYYHNEMFTIENIDGAYFIDNIEETAEG